MPLLSVWSWLKGWRARRDEEKYKSWCAFVQTRQFGGDIFQIVSIRKSYPKKGLKAYARWLDTGATSAIWIKGVWPSIGVFLSASGSYGHGEHHGEEVFYVNQIFGMIDSAYYAAMQRHVARMKSSAATV